LTHDADVLVVGAGASGCAVAIGLTRLGRSVLVVDRWPSRAAELGETLPPSARRALLRLGVGPLGGAHPRCWSYRSAWGTPRLAAYELIRSPYGHGWRIDRSELDRELRGRAASLGARILTGTRIGGSGAWLDSGGWLIPLEDSHGGLAHARAGWVVDATGRARMWSRAMGGRARAVDRLVALSALFTPEREQSGLRDPRFDDPLVESVPGGWWFTAATADGRLAASRFTDADLGPPGRAAAGGAADPAAEGACHTAARLRGCRLEAEPRVSSARSELLEPLTGPGWCAVGDAAAAHDPLCSNGITYGLETGLRAAGAIDAALRGGATAMDTYSDSVRRSFSVYLAARRRWYGAERRWPEMPFWRRRAGGESQPEPGGSSTRSRSNPGFPRSRSQVGSSRSSARVMDG